MGPPAQYGPNVRALAVYLSQQQLLPFARVRAVLSEVVGCPRSVGTVVTLVQRCAAALEGSEAVTKIALQAAPVLHTDETPVRVNGQWQYVHVSSTDRLSHLGLHAQRGATATEAIGILPGFRGTSLHDGWTSYWHYRACRHALCNVPHLRALTWVAEQLEQPWAQALKDLLLEMRAAVATARAAGAQQLETGLYACLIARYRDLLCQGVAANPLPPPPHHPTARPSGAGASRARCVTCSTASSNTKRRSSRFWTTSRCPSTTIRPSGICAGSRSSRRSRAPSAVPWGPRPSAAFGVCSRPFTKPLPICWQPCAPSSRVAHSPSQL